MSTIFCPALGIPQVKEEFEQLVSSVGENVAYQLWDRYKGNVPKPYFNQANVNYQFKAINILLSDKAKQVFAKGQKNNWSLDKILTELAVPQEQKQLLLDLNIKDNKPDVILPIGTSGSGKSTFIKSLPKENLVVIEPDAMRVEFTGNINDKSKDKEIYIEAANRAIKAIKQGKQVVFDTTNLTKDKRLPFIEAIKKAIPNANIQYKLMELNPELAKQRIKAQLERGENRAAVSDETIDRHAASYKQMLEDIKSEPISEFKNIDLREQFDLKQIEQDFTDYNGHPDIEFYLKRNEGKVTSSQITDLCAMTSDICINYLHSKGINVFKHSFIIYPEKNIANFTGNFSNHKVAIAYINNKMYIFDMPQDEYITVNQNNEAVFGKFIPRFIEVTEKNMFKEYGINKIAFNRSFFALNENGETMSSYKVPRSETWFYGKGKDQYINYDGSIYDYFKDGSPVYNIENNKILPEPIFYEQNKPLNEQLALELASKYGFSVEINTAKIDVGSPHAENENEYPEFEYNGEYFARQGGYFIKDTSPTFDNAEIIFTDEYLEALQKSGITLTNSKYYSNLSAPDGTGRNKYEGDPDWEYQELEFKTPLITPSIKGHAQFATEQGIGWARVWYNKKTGVVEIQEIQSDLFQKWRNSFTFNNIKYSIKEDSNKNKHYWKNNTEITANEYTKDWNKFLDTFDNTEDAFTKLLQKDDNWVTFFIKSIIQDSAKKGYEKVLFPKGETAAKIEGHETLEREIKIKDEQIAEIEKLEEEGDIDGAIDQAQSYGIVGEYLIVDILDRLKKQKEDLKNNGIEKLKPIEYKYEVEIRNILVKQFDEWINVKELEQKYGKEWKKGIISEEDFAKHTKGIVKTITDEYGNQWREVTINKERDLATIMFQKQSNIAQINNNYVVSERTIRDLAARMADRIGLKVIYESDLTKDYKGKLKNGVAVINLAYATLDTPIHEILGHPIIKAIKNKNDKKAYYEIDSQTDKYVIVKNQQGGSKVFNTLQEANDFISKENTTTLYQNLLKELEYGRGKEVLDRIKKDYIYKNNLEKGHYELGNYRLSNGKTGYRYFNTIEEAEPYLEATENKYTLEEQQEEAIVELLGLYTADRLDKVKDGKLISLLKRLLKEMKQFVRSLLTQREVEIDKLPDNMTLGDIADLLAYSNSKLILPGNEVVYTTPDNMKFKTYQEASNHISELAKLGEVDVTTPITKYAVHFSYVARDSDGGYDEYPQVVYFYSLKEAEEFSKVIPHGLFNKIEKIENFLPEEFIYKNKEFEQSKEIIEEWKKVNNIQYNPDEVYSRGNEFVSVVGAYSDFDVDLMMQNLLQHIEDNKKAGGKFAISAFTKPIDKSIYHLEGDGGKIKFKIYPQSNDILWAANTDVNSGSVRDAAEKVNKSKQSELLGVSYTKYPSLYKIASVQPNLASIIDNLAHHHNELGIELTDNNFRLEYDEDIPYSTKKIINSINSILDQKYGKLVKPKISKPVSKKVTKFKVKGEPQIFNTREEAQKLANTLSQMDYMSNYVVTTIQVDEAIGKQPTQTNETLKESIGDIKNKLYQNLTLIKNGDFWAVVDENTRKVIVSTENKKEAEDYINKSTKTVTKEYTSQALINTKIAKLKEGARKYARSLIRSEVRPISNMYPEYISEDNELAFQKVSSNNKKKQHYLTTDKQTKETLVPLTLGGFDTSGKSTAHGDGKDVAMREVAGGFIGEVVSNAPSSTATSARVIKSKKSATDLDAKNIISNSNGNKTLIVSPINKVIMLARNGKLYGKPLANETKEKIKAAHDKGYRFVVGDMPNVDSQYIDYLQELGATFTMYHTGNTPRINIVQNTDRIDTTTLTKSTKDYRGLSIGGGFFSEELNTPVSEEQAIVDSQKRELFKENFPKEYEIAEKNEQFMSLKNINHLEKQEIATMMANEISEVINILTHNTDPEISEMLFDDLVSEYKLDEVQIQSLKETQEGDNSRIRAIEIVGIGKILTMVQERLKGYISPEISQGIELSASERKHYDNILQDIVSDVDEGYFKKFLEIAATRIKKLEHIVINIEEKTFTTEESEKADAIEPQPDPELTRNITEEEQVFEDNWMTSYLQRSFIGSLSANIKVRFAMIPVIDIDGMPEVNKFGYPVYYNENDIFDKIMRIVYKKPTAEEQLNALRAEMDKYRWMPKVINIIESDPQLSTECFVNFRKDFISYYKSWVNANGQLVSSTVNSTDGMSSFISDIRGLARAKSLPLFHIKETTASDKLKDELPLLINVAEANKLRKLSSSLGRNYEALSDNKTLKDFASYEKIVYGTPGTEDYKGVFYDLLSLLHSIGLVNIDEKLLELALFANYKEENTTLLKEDLPFFKLLNRIDKLLFTTYNRAIPATGTLNNDHRESINNYKDIFSIFDPYIEQINESMVYEEGKCYYSYAAPNYLNRLINKISTMGHQEFIDWCEKYYLKSIIHGSFFTSQDGGSFAPGFNSWLRDMYVEAKRYVNQDRPVSTTYRGRFKFDTFLSHKSNPDGRGKEFTEMNDYEYTEAELFNYFNRYDNQTDDLARYFMPIMADKAVSGFITAKKYTGKDAVDIVTDKLYSVFLQEVDRIYTVAQRFKNKTNPDIKAIKNFDADFKSDKLTFTKGDSFHFLPFLNKYFADYYSEKPESIVTSLLQEIIESEQYPNIMTILEPVKGEIIKEIKKAFTQDFELWYSQLEVQGYLGKLVERVLPNTDPTTAKAKLAEFYFNSSYAKMQILQLFITDLAFYDSWDDIQKRLAQLRAPGLSYDLQARNKYDENKLFSEDGMQKSIMTTDFIGKANELSDIQEVFKAEENRLITALQEKYKVLPTDSAAVAKTKRQIIEKVTNSIALEYKAKFSNYNEVNSTDGGSIIGINYLKKTEGGLGRWSADKQKLFNHIESILQLNTFEEMQKAITALNPEEFKVVFETRKPFSYSQIEVPAFDGTDRTIKKGYQTKNAEHILLDIYGMLKSGNRLQIGLMKFMYDRDIDVIHTGKTVKTGKQAIIDHTKFETADDFLNELYALTTNKNSIEYQNYVTHVPLEDVALQVETPSKFENKQQDIGGQEEKLLFEGVDENTTFVFQGETVSGKDLQKFYELVLAAKVNLSKNKLFDELGITEQVRQDMNNIGINFNDPSTIVDEEVRKRVMKEKTIINVKLSKKLVAEMVDSDRFSYDLIMAAQLNSNGDFIIPLNDELQFDRIQQTINALIRKTITKQKTAGAQLIQVSDGIRKGQIDTDKALRIVFDTDASGKKRIKYFEAELPAYNKEFYKDFIDENGYLRTDWMPDELLEGIAYRIPTEGFCSMVPIKIVRFSNKINGGLIKLPAAITTITGADFDIDKLFLMFPTLVIDNNLRNSFNEYYEFSPEHLKYTYDSKGMSYYMRMNEHIKDGRVIDKATDFIEIENYLKNRKRYSDLQKVRGIYNEFLFSKKLFTQKYKRPRLMANATLIKSMANDPVTALKTFANELSKSAYPQEELANTILEINKAVLTSSHNVFNTLNASGFPTLKRNANIIAILEATKQYTNEQLIKLDNDELVLLAKKYATPRIYATPMTQAYIFKRNAVGSKLIGITANGNVSQAMLQHYNVKVNPNFIYNLKISPLGKLRLNGIAFESLFKTDKQGNQYIPFSSTYSIDGVTRIANKIRELLAAAVDAAKDPLLEQVNVDRLTITVLESILRFGFDIDSALLLLNQPIIKTFVAKYNSASVEGYIEPLEYIEKFISLYDIASVYENTTFNSDLTNEDMAKYIGETFNPTSKSISDQIQALKFFEAMVAFTKDLRYVNKIAKTDSIAMGVGSTVPETLAKINEIDYFIENTIKGYTYFMPDFVEILNPNNKNHSPLLTAHFEGNRDATQYIFGIINPMYYNDFSRLVNKLQEQSYEPLTVKTITRLQQDYALFKMFLMDKTDLFSTAEILEEKPKNRRVLRGNRTLTKFYTITAVEEFAKAITTLKTDFNYKNNLFIQKLIVEPSTSGSNLNVLSINSFGLQSEDKQLLAAGWTDLILGEERELRDGYTTRQFGLDLIVYSIYKNGFAFGNKSFLYLLSTEVKARLPKYLDYLKTSANTRISDIPGIDIDKEFLALFLRNNSDLRGLIHTISIENLKKIIDSGKTNEQGDYESFYTRAELPLVFKTRTGLYQHVGGGFYKYVTKLGIRGVGKEYTPDMMTFEGRVKDSIYLTNSLQRKKFSGDLTYVTNNESEIESNETSDNDIILNSIISELEYVEKMTTKLIQLTNDEQRKEGFTKLIKGLKTKEAIDQATKNMNEYC